MNTSGNKSGQALLIILLAMATLTTVVMSIVSRSISEVEITNREEESLRAFSAAEAGIEQALVTAAVGTSVSDNLEVPTTQSNQTGISEYNADVSSFPAALNSFTYPVEMLSGESVTIWLVSRDGNTIFDCSSQPCYSGSSIQLCWGEDGIAATNPQAPAVIVSFAFEDSGGDLAMTQLAYDPNSSRRSSNQFSSASTSPACTIDGVTYSFQTTMDLNALGLPVGTPGRVKYMRVKSLYNTSTAQRIGVSSANNFPPQGKLVTSVGKSGNSTRKIEAYLLNPTIPSLFESAIYSPFGITK